MNAGWIAPDSEINSSDREASPYNLWASTNDGMGSGVFTVINVGNEAARVFRSSTTAARRLLKARNVEGVRPVMGLVALSGSYKASEIDKACADALRLDAFRLRQIKDLLRRASPAQPFFPALIQEHKLIRPISEYAAFIAASTKLPTGSDK